MPVGGVLADRHPRRGVVLWSGLAAAGSAPLLAAGLGRSVALTAVAAAVAGAGQGACRPVFQALTAEVVEEGRRQQANAAMTLAVRVTTLVGPGPAALLAPALHIRGLLLGIGLLWLVAALVPGRGTGAGGPAACLVAGLGIELFNVPWLTAIQREVAPERLARVSSLDFLVSYGLAPAGLALIAPAIDAFGLRPVLAACALVCFPHTRHLPAVRKGNFFVLDYNEGISGPRNIDGLEKFARYLRESES